MEVQNKINICAMIPEDYPEVAAIYLEGINSGNSTFTSSPPADWEEWNKSKVSSCSIVAKDRNSVLGWAAVSPVSSRCVYKGVAEVSIYVAEKESGKGIGSALMSKLIDVTENNGIWTLQAGIFPENIASIKLHNKFGFREIGYREKLGKMEFGKYQGKWRNVLLFERRSNKAGI